MVDSLAPVPTDEYAVGDVIADKYRLERLLGEGGQAWVWQARNLALDASVAIKVLRGEGSKTPQRSRLLQEARVAASLGHPAIVRVLDLGEAQTGEPFLVMELLNGQSLADRLVERGRLSPVEAIRVLLPIADALGAAHAKGIVHRDLKPDNVFLSRSDDTLQPKLLDFGIVKVQQAASDWQRLSTITGAVVGSPTYLSPEQARGSSDIDLRVDVWGLSVTLYECLTDEVPFDGDNYNALLRSIVEDEPVSILDRGVNEPELWELVKRGLAKSRDERWPSTRELGRALALWASQRGVVDDVCRAPLESKWLRASAASVVPAVVVSASTTKSEPAAQGASAQPGRRAVLGALVALVVVLGAGWLWSHSQTTRSDVAAAPSTTPSAAQPAQSAAAAPAMPSLFASAAAVPAALHSGNSAPSAPPRASPSSPVEVRPVLPSAEATSRKPNTPRAKASGDLYLISPY